MQTQNDLKIAIAILPFKNLSDQAGNEFFCDGITEEIINALSRIRQLKVTSRTSSFYFKKHHAALPEIAKKLGVTVIIEGSVRIHQNMLRISAQMIQAQEDITIWSETWNREKDNIFEIQDEISLLIADQLREHLGHLEVSESLVEQPTQQVNAYEYYLKGQYHFRRWNPEDVQKSIELFNQALRIDPQLILAHLGLADSYSFMAVAGFAARDAAWAKAILAIDAAKGLDSEHPGVNYMLAHQAFFTQANYAVAFDHLQKALTHQPTHADAQRFISFLYLLAGNQEKAKAHLLYVKSIDPLNLETLFFEANYLYRTGDHDQAQLILGQLLLENPKNLPAIVVHIHILLQQHHIHEALNFLLGVPEELFAPDERLGLLALIEILSGTPNRGSFNKLRQQATDNKAHHAHAYLFICYAVLEAYDEAFETLEKLFSDQSSILLLSFSDPLTANLRKDSRYAQYHPRVYPAIKQIVKAKKQGLATMDEATAEKWKEKIEVFVADERPYLNPALSLRSLAAQIEIHPNQLSWLLNQAIGKNFNEFINQKRIAHFKKLMRDPANAHISLIGLAFESGFNSKTVFNTTFKKQEGMTPKAFLKKYPQD